MRAVFQRLHPKRVCGDGAAHPLLFCVFAHMQFVAVPEAVSAVELVQSIYAAGSPMQTLFTKAGAVLAVLAVLCFLSVILIRRRVFHE